MNQTAVFLRRSLDLRWLCAVTIAYYAAVTIGDNVAVSVFLSRAGISKLPSIFILKAGIDVISALLYLPLTKNRCPRTIWRILLCFYIGVISIGWLAITYFSNPATGAYILYVGHEVAWTLAVIHWGIFLLDLFSPTESRSYFPIVFGVGRIGALLGGLVVWTLAIPLGTSNLLGIAGVLAFTAALTSLKLKNSSQKKTNIQQNHSPTVTSPKRALATWRGAISSPLVRAIALSTATMVLLRYGLKMVSLAEIQSSFASDEEDIESFLGLLTALGNAGAILLSIWVIPRFLSRVGVGVANLTYATTTLVAFISTWLAPGLASASAARFVEMPLKHSLKTPLSVLFYGAESPAMRIAARSFIFGFAIPLAAIFSALSLKQLHSQLELLSILGAITATLYIVICYWQNIRYKEGLKVQLAKQLDSEPTATIVSLDWFETLYEQLPSSYQNVIIPLATQGLSSSNPHIVELTIVWLQEALPAKQAKLLHEHTKTSRKTSSQHPVR